MNVAGLLRSSAGLLLCDMSLHILAKVDDKSPLRRQHALTSILLIELKTHQADV